MKEIKRPDNFEFAMDFLGDPEESIIREYVSKLEKEITNYMDIISNFCKESDWCSESWKRQPHIKAIFDANT